MRFLREFKSSGHGQHALWRNRAIQARKRRFCVSRRTGGPSTPRFCSCITEIGGPMEEWRWPEK